MTDEAGEGGSGCPYHTIVLDCAPIAFIDSTGIAVLEQVSINMLSMIDFLYA